MRRQTAQAFGGGSGQCGRINVRGLLCSLRLCELTTSLPPPALRPICACRQWRERQPAASAGQLRLYYAIFAEVAAAAAALLERGIVHFDLKCDNCLLEALPGELLKLLVLGKRC